MARELVPKFYCRTCDRETVSRVLETRAVRRRRECVECGSTFPTLEVLAPTRRRTYRHRSREPFLPFEENATPSVEPA